MFLTGFVQPQEGFTVVPIKNIVRLGHHRDGRTTTGYGRFQIYDFNRRVVQLSQINTTFWPHCTWVAKVVPYAGVFVGGPSSSLVIRNAVVFQQMHGLKVLGKVLESYVPVHQEPYQRVGLDTVPCDFQHPHG